MQLGGFGMTEHYVAMHDAGYHYAELDMPELEAMDENDFVRFQDVVTAIGMPVRTGARILPLVNPTFFVDGFRPVELAPYLERSCHRAAQLGISKVVLGNGKARALQAPEDIQKESVFLDFLRMLAEIAGKNGQDLILEPLGPKYSNYINTIPEAVRVIEQVNMPNLFTMADLRHMVWSKEDFNDLTTYVQYIHHIHVDYPCSFPARGYPNASDQYDYGAFIKAIIASGYQDTITVEVDIPADWNAAHNGVMQVLGELF